MTYRKPEVTELGDASRVIQQIGKVGTLESSKHPKVSPAYDLDE